MLLPASRTTAERADFLGFAICRSLGERAALTAVASSVRQELARGKTLFSEGHQADSVYEVSHGTLRLHRLLRDGRRQITGFPSLGRILGLARDDLYLHSAEAITEVTVRRYSRAGFSRLVDYVPGFRQRLMAITSEELSAAQDHILLLGRKTAIEKVASFILRTRRLRWHRQSGKCTYSHDRADIADYLGLTAETVSRAFSALQHDRTIERLSISCLKSSINTS